MSRYWWQSENEFPRRGPGGPRIRTAGFGGESDLMEVSENAISEGFTYFDGMIKARSSDATGRGFNDISGHVASAYQRMLAIEDPIELAVRLSEEPELKAALVDYDPSARSFVERCERVAASIPRTVECESVLRSIEFPPVPAYLAAVHERLRSIEDPLELVVALEDQPQFESLFVGAHPWVEELVGHYRALLKKYPRLEFRLRERVASRLRS